MAANREHPAVSDRPVTHHLVEEAPQLAAPPRYVWPRIGPVVFALLWVGGMTLGRWIDVWQLSMPGRLTVLIAVTSALYSVIMLAGRVRPTDTGGE